MEAGDHGAHGPAAPALVEGALAPERDHAKEETVVKGVQVLLRSVTPAPVQVGVQYNMWFLPDQCPF